MVDIDLKQIIDFLYDAKREFEEKIELGYDPKGDEYKPKLKKLKVLIKDLESTQEKQEQAA